MSLFSRALGIPANAPGVLLAPPPGFAKRFLEGDDAPRVEAIGKVDLAWGVAFCRSLQDANRFGAVLAESLADDGLLWCAFETGGPLSNQDAWASLRGLGYWPVAELHLEGSWRAVRQRKVSALLSEARG